VTVDDRSSTADRGFTLIEVIIAMVITVVVMAALAYTVVGSLTTIQQARQRQTAAALVTQQLERLRAMPYDSVTQPDPTAPTVSVDYTTTSGGVTTFAPPARLLAGVSEPLVVNTVSGKSFDQLIDRVTYHVETYVTKPAATTSGSQPYNLTAIAKWTSTVSHGSREIIQRSTTFSPAGCLSTATSPFAAPCQPYYTARAGEALSGVTITNTDSSALAIPGMDATSLQLGFGHTSTNLLSEQTVTATGADGTSSGKVVGTTTSTTGGETASVAIDSDPSSTPNQLMTATAPAHTANTLTTTGSGGTLSIQPSSSDAGSAGAAIQADNTLCMNATGSGLTTGPSASQLRPCAAAAGQALGGSATVRYTSPSGASSLTLAAFATGAPQSRATAALLGASNGAGVCSASTPVDCAHAAASRTLGTASFGVLPGTSSTAGFDPSKGLWSVTSYAETARAEEGFGALAPAFTRTGSLQVFQDNGAGGGTYTTVDLSTFASVATGLLPPSQTWNLAPTTVSYTDVKLVYSGTLMVQRPRISQSPTSRTGVPTTDCKTTPCTSTINASGAITARVDVAVQTLGGAPITQFSVVTDLGGLTADASYKAAANA